MNLTDKDYNKIIEELNKIELEDNEQYDIHDYIDAFSNVVDKEHVNAYMDNQEITIGKLRDIYIDVFAAFIEKLNPVKADKKYDFLVKHVRDENGNIKNYNKGAEEIQTTNIIEKAKEMERNDYISNLVIKFFEDAFNKGSELSDNAIEKFSNVPVHKTVKHTSNIFKNIFKVNKTNEELEALKKKDVEQYKKESKGSVALNENNTKQILDNYKLLNDKVKKTGFLEKVFHLPSFLKLKSNIKSMKKQMINKGINEKLIDKVAAGEETTVNAFNKNMIYNGENVVENSLSNQKPNVTIEEIDRKAEKIKKSNEKLQSKAHSTAKFYDKDRAKKHWKAMKESQKKIDEYLERLAKGDKYVEDLKSQIVSDKETQQEMLSRYKTVTKQLNAKELDAEDIKKFANIDINNSKEPITADVVKTINQCKEFCELRQNITELEKTITEKEDAVKETGRLAERKRELKFFIDKEKATLIQEQKKVVKYMASSLDKLNQIDKMFTKEEAQPKLFNQEDLKKKSEIIQEVDEDEYDEEIDTNIDFHKRLDEDTKVDTIATEEDLQNESFVKENEIEEIKTIEKD